MINRESNSSIKRKQTPSLPGGNRQANAWHIGRREVIAAILGVLLYGLLSHANLIILISSGTPDVFLPALLIPVWWWAGRRRAGGRGTSVPPSLRPRRPAPLCPPSAPRTSRP